MTALSQSHVKKSYGSYFFPIPVIRFDYARRPCVSLTIDQQEVSAIVNLGLEAQFSISPEIISTVNDLKCIGLQKMCEIRGVFREQKLYDMAQIMINPIIFSHPIVCESLEIMEEEAQLIRGDMPFTREFAAIGWKCFKETNILFDLSKPQLAFCDSIGTLKKYGCEIKRFTKVPFYLNRGIVEIEAICRGKMARYMLDTGATWNIVSTTHRNWPTKEYPLRYAPLQIGDQDFGVIPVHIVPNRFPVFVEFILGMDFFEKHIVFLDFSEGYAYFQKVPVVGLCKK
jgi:hypothetical protein